MKIVKVYKEDCVPCKILSERLEEADIDHEPLEVDADIAAKHNLKTVPALLFLDDEGNEVGRLLGLVSIEQVKRRLDDS